MKDASRRKRCCIRQRLTTVHACPRNMRWMFRSLFWLPKIIARKSKVVRKLVLGVKAKLTSNNVAMVTGEAQIIDKNTVRCGEETYNAENLILCTGSGNLHPSYYRRGNGELLDTSGCAGQIRNCLPPLPLWAVAWSVWSLHHSLIVSGAGNGDWDDGWDFGRNG